LKDVLAHPRRCRVGGEAQVGKDLDVHKISRLLQRQCATGS
jgi:hypothetical protein